MKNEQGMPMMNTNMEEKNLAWRLFWVFFKVGCFTFGGGLAMLPLIRREVVEVQKWMTEEDIVDAFAIAQSLPGALAVNTGIFIGRKLRGSLGAVMALLGVILPAFISILIAMAILTSLSENIYVGKFFAGIRAASTALILLAAIHLGKSAASGRYGYFIAAVSFLMIVIFNINAAWAVVFGGLAGWLIYLFPERSR